MRFKPMRLKLIKIGCIVILVNVLSFNISFWTSSLSPHPGNGPFQYVVLQESATTVLYPLIMWVTIGIALYPIYGIFHSQAVSSMAIRIGWENLYRRSIVKIFLSACIIRFLTECLNIVAVHCWNPFTLEPFQIESLWTMSELINHANTGIVFAHWILASVGTGIYVVFVFLMADYIRNAYIYILIPIIHKFLSVFIYIAAFTSLVTLIPTIAEKTPVRAILSIVMPSSILSPGTHYGYVLQSFISASVLYVLVSYILYRFTLKRRRLYG